MIEFIVLAIAILAATTTAAYSLTLLDRIVHVRLYDYGLQFSLEWANPYWTVLRITLVLLGIVAAFTLVNMVLIYRQSVYQKQLALRASERAKAILTQRKEVIQPPPQLRQLPSTPQPKPQPEVPPVSPVRMPPTPTSATVSSTPELVQCHHCGKAFTQPLRMLDFHGERPRIVSICPFCNEVIQPTSRQDEMEQSRREEQKRKRNDKTHETVVTPTLGE